MSPRSLAGRVWHTSPTLRAGKDSKPDAGAAAQGSSNNNNNKNKNMKKKSPIQKFVT
jgi:hypothetical protein